MKPKELWTTHGDYQEFSLDDFRKHVYQEKYRQLAGPYWQKKRNKAAMKVHKKAVDKMYVEWQHTKLENDINEITQQISRV
jgi:hypothetical protein